MYADTELFPYLQGLGLSFSLEEIHLQDQQFQLQEEELLHQFQQCDGFSDDDFINNSNYFSNHIQLSTDSSSGSNLVRTPSISEYDLGGEGDLFKAPEAIMEEPIHALNPVTASISTLSCPEDITTKAIEVEDLEAIANDHLFSEVFKECKDDILEDSTIKETYPELADVNFPSLDMNDEDVKFPSMDSNDDQTTQADNMVAVEGPIQKSVSHGCLASEDWTNGGPSRPSFLDFQEVDFRLRRAFSEGDIKTLGKGLNTTVINMNVLPPPYERILTVDDYKIEERRQKLSRYRTKKTKRNFGRKIKYACRKALADNQPRVRGRFAKTEECELPKPSK